MRKRRQPQQIVAIDLFCGAGGLSAGLKASGVRVVAGVDVDETCAYPFEANIGADFLARDVREVKGEELVARWPEGAVRLLAGCAPCQPFSPYRRGIDTSGEEHWPLLGEFTRLVREIEPELVTMENVARIGKSVVFNEFVTELRGLGYRVSHRSCYGPDYGLPQHRRRLILVASLLGPINVPKGTVPDHAYATVKDTISALPPIVSGGADPADPLHKARSLTPINIERIRASRPGGTWRDWPKELRAPCHRKASGKSFGNVYARMEWDQPAPTITTLAHNFGAGRFGHPEQDRPISLREAAMLQGFDRDYRFVPDDAPVNFSHLGRLIGNAVPPPLGRAIGAQFIEHVANEQVA